MSREEQITVDQYRTKHKRCKTCLYACQEGVGWLCRATGSSYEGKVGWTIIKGCFCKLYRAKGESE